MRDSPTTLKVLKPVAFMLAILAPVLAATNPSKADHFAAMRNQASDQGPYPLSPADMDSAGFTYHNFGLFSQMRVDGTAYTYGVLASVRRTSSIKAKAIERKYFPIRAD